MPGRDSAAAIRQALLGLGFDRVGFTPAPKQSRAPGRSASAAATREGGPTSESGGKKKSGSKKKGSARSKKKRGGGGDGGQAELF